MVQNISDMSENSALSQAASGATSVRGRSLDDRRIVTVEFSGGIITGVDSEERSSPETDPSCYIAPGFIDNQVNGYKGIDFTDPGLTVAQIRTVTAELRNEGVTSYLPTLITGNPVDLIRNLKVFNEAIRDPSIGASIPGIHLEGPYISPVDGYRGAHNRQWTRLPDWREFMKFQKASGNHIRQITLAPELSGAIAFIRKAREAGVIVALGHHNAPASVIEEAVTAGATLSTHLGNGCANMIHRHHNPIWPQLAEPRLYAGIIADGFHLTIPEMKVFYSVKGVNKLILVSDMTQIGGLAPGEHLWNGKKVVLEKNGALKYPEQDVLAGSSVTLRKCVENMTKYTGCSLTDSVKMATFNPAAINNLDDRGSLEPGKRTDIVLFDYDGVNITIRECLVNGERVKG